MRLTKPQLDRYHRDGFLELDRALSAEETQVLREAFARDCDVPGPHRVLEDDRTVRAVYASHQRQREFAALVRDRRLLAPARQLLGDQVYVYQLKINSKSPFTGEGWSWHQDYPAWRIADSLAEPRQVNVAVFLDDVDEFNGPVVFVPGSHRFGPLHLDRTPDAKSDQHIDPDDIALTREQLAKLVDAGAMVAPKGPAGTVVFFSSEVVHGSGVNISPYPRHLLIVTYNDVSNPPSWRGEPRPGYVVCRDNDPLTYLDDPLGPWTVRRAATVPVSEDIR
ncbi:phytanoyl-CoA dioxygenase family protein [Amycolatopsis aidingensis]|uniref:phytanoyl-CoA dioxygenase family protein n=1 Tax=Amycolatopsis aidingensis TaxID=2842453 RepID=UPI001C0D911B|nr:phytanoyl-CoA dioxygenase family protein [Amycolatopsis aidingensis]